MSDQDLKQGTIVYHKAFGLRMVILEVLDDNYYCRYVDAQGDFAARNFYKFEVTTVKPTSVYRQLTKSKKDS